MIEGRTGFLLKGKGLSYLSHVLPTFQLVYINLLYTTQIYTRLIFNMYLRYSHVHKNFIQVGQVGQVGQSNCFQKDTASYLLFDGRTGRTKGKLCLGRLRDLVILQAVRIHDHVFYIPNVERQTRVDIPHDGSVTVGSISKHIGYVSSTGAKVLWCSLLSWTTSFRIVGTRSYFGMRTTIKRYALYATVLNLIVSATHTSNRGYHYAY